MKESETPTENRYESGHRERSREVKENVPLGRTIYERDIRRRIEEGNVGKICAIDVESGCWAVGETAREAASLLREQTPEAIDVWLERVGYWGLRNFGAGSLRRTD